MTVKKNKVEKKEVYSAKVYCRNCNQGNIKVTKDGEFFSDDLVVEIIKGTPLKDAKCPNCGCENLSLVKE